MIVKIFDFRENASSSADIFLEIISDTLHVLHNQKTFIQDLLEKQPLHNDLELLRQICHDLYPNIELFLYFLNVEFILWFYFIFASYIF